MLPFPCRLVMGPMVGASDLAFRMLCRRHGADACYTEMLFAERLVNDPSYRARKLDTCPADRPLVVQLQGSEPDSVAAAARAVVASCSCDAIDLNLGCPLPQAREGRFGAFLLDREHWSTVGAVVRSLVAAVALPIFVKIRLLETTEETVELCNLLIDAGCSLIAVHGRRRPPAGEHRGERQRVSADLDAIRCVRNAITRVPLLTNGNTLLAADVACNLAHTRAHGIMCAEGLLRNPLLFEHYLTLERRKAIECGNDACLSLLSEGPSNGTPASLPRQDLAHVAIEYLTLCKEHPPEDISVVRGHLMWLLGKSGKGHRCLFDHLGPYTPAQLRMALMEASSVSALEDIVRVTVV
jgi:tRNA-dihydrouridine synthase 1